MEQAAKKANEIANQFYEGSVFDHSNEEHAIEKEKAKKRATKAVELLMNEAWVVENAPTFWQRVHSEIKKL